MADNNTVGYHIKVKSTTTPVTSYINLLDAIKHAYENEKLNVMQIFTHMPQTGIPTKLNIDEIKKYITDKNLTVFVHAAYVTTSIFNDARVDRLNSELKIASEIGAKGLVIHIARNTPENIITILKKYHKMWSVYNIPIVIENSPYKEDKKNTEVYTTHTVDKLNNLFKKLEDNFDKSYVRGCIDTAHLFASGIEPKDWCKINLNIISLIHFNGSESDLGSGKDKHSIPYSDTDKIPKKYLMKFSKYCNIDNKIPMVIEPNRGASDDITKAINCC